MQSELNWQCLNYEFNALPKLSYALNKLNILNQLNNIN